MGCLEWLREGVATTSKKTTNAQAPALHAARKGRQSEKRRISRRSAKLAAERAALGLPDPCYLAGRDGVDWGLRW